MAKVLFGLRVKAEQKPISHSWVFVAWARKWVHKAKHLLPHYGVIQFLKTLISGEAKRKIKVIFKYANWKVNVASVPQICQTIICWPPTDSLCELRQSKNLDKRIWPNMKKRIACKHRWHTRLLWRTWSDSVIGIYKTKPGIWAYLKLYWLWIHDQTIFHWGTEVTGCLQS